MRPDVRFLPGRRGGDGGRGFKGRQPAVYGRRREVKYERCLARYGRVGADREKRGKGVKMNEKRV